MQTVLSFSSTRASAAAPSMDSQGPQSFKELFIGGLLLLSERLKAAGFKHTLYSEKDSASSTWNIFSAMPSERQEKILSDFHVYNQVMQSVLAENLDWSDNSATLWAAIKSLGVLPSNEVFNNLEPDDVIEIYRNDGLQVFRNMRFHQICSYNLHDLFVRPWDDLFIRDPLVTKEIQKGAGIVFTPPAAVVSLDHIPAHSMFEKDSPSMFVMRMKERYLAPLKDKRGTILYAVAVSKVTVLEKERTHLIFEETGL